MSPEYFIISLIMGQASGIIESLKTGIILFDITVLSLFVFLFYNTDKEYIKEFYRRFTEHNKKSIVISTELNSRSTKFKAIMFFLANRNETVYRLKEDLEFDIDFISNLIKEHQDEPNKTQKNIDDIKSLSEDLNELKNKLGQLKNRG